MKIGGTLYFDHQATTPVDEAVIAAMTPFYREDFGNPHSSDHVLGWKSAQAVGAAKTSVGNLIGADADEIVLTSGATESNNLAILGVGRKAGSGRRRKILVSSIDHKSVLAAARSLQKFERFEVEMIPVDRLGVLDLGRLKELITEQVLMVSVMAVNNEVGAIQPIDVVSQLCRECGVLLHCDAAQAPGAIPTENLAKMTDLLSLSGHKIYGPKGIGALYVRRSIQNQIEPLIYGGGQQDNMRSGTLPTPLCVGFGTAASIFRGPQIRFITESIREKRDLFEQLLRELEWQTKVNGPASERRHPCNANLQFPGFMSQDILAALQPKLAASTGSACTSGITEPSHVLRAMGLSTDEAESSIRFSLGRHTTTSDVIEAVALIGQVLSDLSENLR